MESHRRHIVLIGLTCLMLSALPSAQELGLVARSLHRALVISGIPITGVSIGDPANKATWKVHPSSLQAAAQPTIDAFDVNNPAHEAAEHDARVRAMLGTERIYPALVWVMLKQLYPTDSDAQTKTKYQTAYTQLVDVYNTQPWK